MKLEEEMPNPTFVDLKPDRQLLDPKFDGYKLSLDPLPIYCLPLTTGIDRVGPTDDQYSIQHAKLFGHTNSLYSDNWNPSNFYFVDDEWNVCLISFDVEAGRFSPIQVTWTIPTKIFRKTGRYNVSIVFPDDQYAVLSDGCGTLFILNTGNRLKPDTWKVNKQLTFQDGRLDDSLDQFVVLDSKKYKCLEVQKMDILLMRISNKNDKKLAEFLSSHENQFSKKSANHPFVTTLSWITIGQDNCEIWDLKSTRTLIGPSSVDYASIEPFGTGILIASENPFVFSYISDEPLKYIEKKSKKLNQEGQLENKPEYFWMQNQEEITIWFKIPIGANKHDITVDIKPSSISLSYNRNVMLEGEFLHKVKADETVWTITPARTLPVDDNNTGEIEPTNKFFQCLEIILQKVENLKWDGESFVKDNLTGQEISDPELIKEIHTRLEHLCSDKWDADPLRANVLDSQELEECDGFPADTASFMRIDRELQCISHLASLGSHQWLLNTKAQNNLIPAICIRHDVDGLVWQPSESIDKAKKWTLNHIGTFSAIGYVQASKQQRRFTVSPPDLSYIAILDVLKHVYIYRQPNQMETDLRNRRTGARVSHISKQQVISIDPPLETLGAFASNSFLFILTKQNIHAIRIKEIQENL